jgi:MATE family multidrug resistance protein
MPTSSTPPAPRQDWRALLQLAWPMLIGPIAQVAMGVADTVMAGAVSATDLAAVAVGFSLWLPLSLITAGVFSGTTALVARAVGSGRRADLAGVLQQATWLALALGGLNALRVLQREKLLGLMAGDPAVRPLSMLYLQGIAIGMPAAALAQVLRAFSEGSGRSKPVMLINVLALLINVPLNYMLIHGLFGLPKLGGAGCGWATGIALWLQFLMLAALLYPRYRALLGGWQAPRRAALWAQLRLGLPIGMAIFAEISIFSVIALLIGHLGATTIAAHQIALNVSALTFMLPSSLGLALTVKIGHALGAGEPARARRFVGLGTGTAVVAALCNAALMLLLPYAIASVYTSDENVRLLAVALMALAAIYQLPDCLQVTAAGSLRGYHDTRVVMLITLLAYWGIGLPVGYALGLTDLLRPALGVQGLWIGLIVGLTTSAVLLNWRLWKVSRR